MPNAPGSILSDEGDLVNNANLYVKSQLRIGRNNAFSFPLASGEFADSFLLDRPRPSFEPAPNEATHCLEQELDRAKEDRLLRWPDVTKLSFVLGYPGVRVRQASVGIRGIPERHQEGIIAGDVGVVRLDIEIIARQPIVGINGTADAIGLDIDPLATVLEKKEGKRASGK